MTNSPRIRNHRAYGLAAFLLAAALPSAIQGATITYSFQPAAGTAQGVTYAYAGGSGQLDTIPNLIVTQSIGDLLMSVTGHGDKLDFFSLFPVSYSVGPVGQLATGQTAVKLWFSWVQLTGWWQYRLEFAPTGDPKVPVTYEAGQVGVADGVTAYSLGLRAAEVPEPSTLTAMLILFGLWGAFYELFCWLRSSNRSR